MTPGGRLTAIIELLQLVYETPRPADGTVAAYFRGRRFMGSKDRAFIAEKVYDTLRNHARLHWWIERVGGNATARTRALANALLADRQPARLIEGMFSGTFAPIDLSIYEADMVQKLDGHTLEHPEMPDTVRGEVPDWAEAPLRAAFGSDFAREAAALIPQAALDLRVNTLVANREDVKRQLAEAEIYTTEGKFSPLALRVKGRPSLMAHPLYKKGAIEIQDEGSQLVALLTDAREGMAVLDFCAGAGGKTLALGAAMQNKGRIVACDVLGGRLIRAKERFRRAGLQNVETRALDDEAGKWLKRRAGTFDRVLVDAPCSGSGTWRRNPDMRWRPLGPGLAELGRLQFEILERAAPMVKPGGRLIYATCSLFREENELMVEKFLTAHSDFTLLPMEPLARELLPEARIGGDFLRLTPARHQTDGFFAAVLGRAT